MMKRPVERNSTRCVKPKRASEQRHNTNKKADSNQMTIVRKMETKMKKATKTVSIKMKTKTRKATITSDIIWFV